MQSTWRWFDREFEFGFPSEKLDEILVRLRTRRVELVTRVEGLGAKDLERVTQHPRLGVPMRVVDLCFFVAEHDDAHLARVRELQRLWE